jgi:hypothetical protein
MIAQPLRPGTLGVVERRVRQSGERSEVAELSVDWCEIDGDLLGIGAEVPRLFHQDRAYAKGAACGEIPAEREPCFRIARRPPHRVVVQGLRREHASHAQQIVRAGEDTLGLQGCGSEKRKG